MAVPDVFLKTSVTLDGTTMSVSEWCSVRGLSASTVYGRRQKGHNWEGALAPVQKKKHPFSRLGLMARKKASAKRAAA